MLFGTFQNAVGTSFPSSSSPSTTFIIILSIAATAFIKRTWRSRLKLRHQQHKQQQQWQQRNPTIVARPVELSSRAASSLPSHFLQHSILLSNSLLSKFTGFILFLLLFSFIQMPTAFAALPSSPAAYEFDNALLGQPNISCHPDTIEMRFRTKRPFTGKIYVQGHYSNPDCRVDFSQTGNAEHDGRGGIRLHHGSCDMDRQRMVVPSEGMQFSTVLVISFHPLFVTKTDRAFHINCMYREVSTGVGADITVGDVTPAQIMHDLPLPNCEYSIRKGQIDGEVLKYAHVGDLIVHKWECKSDMYGMLVHSCYVEDGQGERVEVIDAHGCHKDPNVLGDPTYSEALNLAYRESYVFKFRDRVGVRFSCEIKLCVKADDGCADITPPDCQGVRFQNSMDDALKRNNGGNQSNELAAYKSHRHRRASSATLLPKTVDADLISQYVFVLDEPVEGEEDDADEGFGQTTRNNKQQLKQQAPLSINGGISSPTSSVVDGGGSAVCISTALFAALVLVVLITFGLAAAVVGHAICRQYKRVHQHQCATANRIIAAAATSTSSHWSCSSPTASSSPANSIGRTSATRLFMKR